MRSLIIVLLITLLNGNNLFAQKSDCNLLTDRETEEGHIKSTRRTAMIDLPDNAFGIILQNYSGNLKMLIDWAFSTKKITQKFTIANNNSVTFILKNGHAIQFEIKEPQRGAGSLRQSWGNYEVGGMINFSAAQADTLLQAPIASMLLSYYGLPADTINTVEAKDYFIKTVPCIK